MTRPPSADLHNVNESRPTWDLLDEILVALPGAVVLAHRGLQRLVVSAGGVFVLDPGPEGLGPVAERAAAAAQATRTLLAEHLSWVPFVDWFVVSAADSVLDAHDVVPLDLVPATVLEGHTIDTALLADIRRLLFDGRLAPQWHDGLPLVGSDLGDVLARMRPTI
jgi:hypothetical protein